MKPSGRSRVQDLPPGSPVAPTTEAPRKPPLTTPQQDLARRLYPLARAYATLASRAWPALRSDFHSECALAVCTAAESYEPGRGTKPSTWAVYHILGAIRDVQRKAIPLGFRGNPDEAPGIEQLYEGTVPIRVRVLGRESAPDRAILDAEREASAEADFEKYLATLPARHRAVTRGIVLEGKTGPQVGADLGYSAAHVRRTYLDALAVLRGDRPMLRVYRRRGDGS